MGWFLVICLLFGLAGSLISASAQDVGNLKVVIENATNADDFNCGTVRIELFDQPVPVGEAGIDGVVYDEVTLGFAIFRITATANEEGYEFVDLFVDGVTFAKNENQVSFFMDGEAVTVTAIFREIQIEGEEPEEKESVTPPVVIPPSIPDDGGYEPPISYHLDYVKALTLSVNSRYPEEFMGLSLAELSEALEIVLVVDDNYNSAEIACKIESSKDYKLEIFDEPGVYPVTFTVKYNGRSYTGKVELNIVDLTPPSIRSEVENFELYLELENASATPKTLAELAALLKVTAVDNYDGPVPVDCEIDGFDFADIDWTVDGEYDLIFYAEDEAGNTIGQCMRVYVSTAAVVPEPPVSPAPPAGTEDWPPAVWEKIPETAILVSLPDGNWDVQDPVDHSIGTVTKDENDEWVFLSGDETPTGSYTNLPETGSMMTSLAVLLGFALVLLGGLLRKKY